MLNYAKGDRVFVVCIRSGAGIHLTQYENADPLISVREVAVVGDVVEKLRKYKSDLESYRFEHKRIWDLAEAEIKEIARKRDAARNGLAVVSLEDYV